MYLHNTKIVDIESWKREAPPQGGDIQWKDGRSAKELARYITSSLPQMPGENDEIML